MQSADSVFKVKDLSIFYGDNQAVKEVNLEIDKKAITALIGPSGCGKSTFLRSINRTNDLIPTSSNQGEIIYEDVNLIDDNINMISLSKEIGMIFQKPNPFPKSIYNNIAHASKFYAIKKKKKMNRNKEDN